MHGRAHILDPGHRAQRPDRLSDDSGGEHESLQHVPMHAGSRREAGFAHHRDIQLHDAQDARRLLLAVPHSLWPGLPRRLRRTHADVRLHDRTDGGGFLMAAETQAPATGAAGRGPSHGLRIFLLWLVLAAAADLIYWLGLGPNVPPGTLSAAAPGQQFGLNVSAGLHLTGA